MKSSWILSPAKENKRLCEELERELSCEQQFAQILLNLGVDSLARAKSFLSPKVKDLLDPFLFLQMKKATQTVIKAIKTQKKILIYGDFDVDGVTSVTVLYKGLLGLGAKVDFFIPDRLQDGYGLSSGCVDTILRDPPELLITVDCGVSAVEQVARLVAAGVEVIITDHHLPQGELPLAGAILNPQLEDSGYPCKYLAGVGVAFKLLSGVCQLLEVDLVKHLYPYLIFVCLGTIADIVPLVEENRTMARVGLLSIKNRFNKGLTALIEGCGMTPENLSSANIVFNIAPRINVAGRMGNVLQAVRLFLSEDKEEISKIVHELEELNTVRRNEQDEIYQEACLQIANKYPDSQALRTLVVSDPSWHVGIIGIVASKLVENYRRPVIVLGEENGVLRGSARSVAGFNIAQAIKGGSEFLQGFGGHRYAAGLSMLKEFLPKFEARLQEYTSVNLTQEMVKPIYKVDAELRLEQIDNRFVQMLSRLSPYGPGNHKPVFYSQGLSIVGSARIVGQNHLQVKLTDGQKELNFIGFGLGDYQKKLSYNSKVEAVYSLDFNYWQDKVSIQGYLKDLNVY